MVVNETLLNKSNNNEWNGIDICLTNNHLPNFCDIFMLIPLLAITAVNYDSYCLMNVRYIHKTIHAV